MQLTHWKPWLYKLIAEVVPVVAQAEADVSPEESENRLREACPLFTEADLQGETDEVKRIRNAAHAKSAWAKPPENRVDHSVQGRLHIVEMLEGLLAADRVVLISRTAISNWAGANQRHSGHMTYDASVSGPAKHSSAITLEGCIEGLTDHPRMKVCLRQDCKSKGRPKPLWAFTTNKDAQDGHSGVCHECEATRQKKTCGVL